MLNERMPLYLRIQSYFKDLISSGKLVENDRILTEIEIMELFRVSRITVANALSGLAKEGWIYRIPGRGSFVMNRDDDSTPGSLVADQQTNSLPLSFSRLAASNKRIIGLVMTTIGDFFAIRLIQGIHQILNANGFNLIIMLTLNSQEREQFAIKELTQMGAEGLLIFPSDGEVYNEEILALKIKGFPFVLIDRYLPGIETNIISSDGSLGAQMAVSHLWELGHREIALCASVLVPSVTVEERISGYMKELKARGGLINPRNILTNSPIKNDSGSEDNSFFRYMEKSDTTAYIALNGKLGLMLSGIAKRLGKRVPEDISILTFDDPTPGYDRKSIFTHIDQSEEQMGREAASLIIKMLNEDKSNKSAVYVKNTMEPKLVVCRSTGPAVLKTT